MTISENAEPRQEEEMPTTDFWNLTFYAFGGSLLGVVLFPALIMMLVYPLQCLPLLSCPGRTSNPESSAVGALRTIVTSNQQFRILKKANNDDGEPRYGTFEELIEHEMVDAAFAEGYKAQYHYILHVSRDGQSFAVYAFPSREIRGMRRFYTDETGRVTWDTDGQPGPASQEVD